MYPSRRDDSPNLVRIRRIQRDRRERFSLLGIFVVSPLSAEADVAHPTTPCAVLRTFERTADARPSATHRAGDPKPRCRVPRPGVGDRIGSGWLRTLFTPRQGTRQLVLGYIGFPGQHPRQQDESRDAPDLNMVEAAPRLRGRQRPGILALSVRKRDPDARSYRVLPVPFLGCHVCPRIYASRLRHDLLRK